MNTSRKHVVVGGGLCGLFTALALCERGLGERVVLVERDAELGGLLRSYHYPEAGWFDYGTHYMAESGIAEVDRLLQGLLPDGEWNYLAGNRRDLGGVYFNGTTQFHTPYPDLRSLPEESLRRCVADFFLHLNRNPTVPAHGSAADVATALFGEEVVRTVVDPVLRKLYGKPAAELTPLALRITPLGRVAFLDEAVVEQLTAPPLLRERVAYTEQRALPAERASGKASYYPRSGGMYRFIEAAEARLAAAGVQIWKDAQLTTLSTDRGRLEEVEVQTADGTRQVPLEHLYWTVGLVPLVKALGLALPPMTYDPPRRTVIVNLLLDAPLALGDLFYCYFYDAPLHSFRVANYINYCPDAVREAGVPVSVELLVDDASDRAALVALAVDELRQTGLLTDQTVRFARAEVLAQGFPMPSMRNAAAMEAVRSLLDAHAYGNLTRLGIMSEEGVFFQSDVIDQVYRRVWRPEAPRAAAAS